jgi:2-iminobutanoate/2-iminopropanoate deaminase
MKDIIATDHAPKPIGPYSQAVRAHGFLFAAQIALDPNTNTLLEGDVAHKTERTLENLKAILTHVEGAGVDNSAKTMPVSSCNSNDFLWHPQNQLHLIAFVVLRRRGEAKAAFRNV